MRYLVPGIPGLRMAGVPALLALALATVASAATLKELGEWPGYGRGEAQRLAVADGHAFVAAGAGGLVVFDVSDPAHPSVVGRRVTPGPVFSLVVADGLAYLALDWLGLEIVDVRDPRAPRLVGSYSVRRGDVNDVKVAGTFAYLTKIEIDEAQTKGLVILDVSNPADPREVGRLSLPRFINLAVHQGWAYVSSLQTFGPSGLDVVDVRDPAAPRLAGAFNTWGPVSRVTIDGTRAYAGTPAGLEILDVTDPGKPTRLATLSAPGSQVFATGQGGLVYVARGAEGVDVVDVSDPRTPVVVGKYTGATDLADLAIDGTRVFAVGPTSGLEVLDMATPDQPRRIGSHRLGGYTSAVAIAGTYAYLCDGPGGFSVLDVSDPRRPRQVAELPELQAQACSIVGTLAFVAAGRSGMRVLDLREPAHPIVVGRFETGDPLDVASQIAVAGRHAYLATKKDLPPPTWSEDLHVLDISDPTQPRRVGVILPWGTASIDLRESGGYLYTLGRIFDLGNPVQPEAIPFPVGVSYERRIVVAGRYAYLPTQGGFIYLMDVSDPRHPAGAGYVQPVPDGFELAVEGRYGFIGGPDPAIHVLDMRDPLQPRPINRTPSLASPDRLVVSGNHVYAAMGTQGFQVFEFSAEAYGPAGMRIAGPDAVPGGVRARGDAPFSALAEFDDGYVRDVTELARWDVVETSVPATTFNGAVLRTGMTATGGRARLRARWVDGDIEFAAEKEVRIEPMAWFAADFNWALTGGGIPGLEYRFTVPERGGHGLTYTWTIDGESVGGAREVIRAFAFPGDHTARLDVWSGPLPAVAQLERRFGVERRAPGEPMSPAAASIRQGVLFDAFPEESEGSEDDGPLTFHSPEREAGLVVLIHDLCGSRESTWMPDLAEAIQRERDAAGQTPPMIAMFDWHDDAAPPDAPRPSQDRGSPCDCQELYFHLATRTQRTVAMTQGQQLAGLLWGYRQSGELPAGVPIHLIGHGVGGIIAAECATLLKAFEPAPIVVRQVTLLDTVHPARRHHDEFAVPGGGQLERYVWSVAGQFAPKLDGANSAWLEANAGVFSLAGVDGVPWDAALDRVPLPAVAGTSRYQRVEAAALRGSERESTLAHAECPRWYISTVTGETTNAGYAFSPWVGREFPGAAAGAVEAVAPAASPESVIGLPDPTTFGSVSRAGDTFTLAEADNAGLLFQRFALPVGAESLRLQFQFVTPGDGDFLEVNWGTNVVLGLGLDGTLSRSGWVPIELPLAPYAGETNDLVLKLVSRGDANASLRLQGLQIVVPSDPDLDGLGSEEEMAAGTDARRADTDGDGVDDGDEVKVHRTHPLERDTDGDGVSDGEELRAGTSPLDGLSVLRLRLSREAGGGWRLRWEGSKDRRDRLRCADALPPTVIRTVATGLGGNDGEVSHMIPDSSAGSRYYWVESDQGPGS